MCSSDLGLHYQWKKNGVDVGTDAASYSLTTVSGDNGAAITVVVTGACSPAATSTAAVLTVNAAPSITAQPVSTSVCAGAVASFAVTATGTGLHYQWKKNGVDVGTDAASYSLTTVSGDNGATITVVVTGTCSPAATSTAAVLTVNTAPAITAQPASTSVCAGAVASFAVTATGTGLHYQWKKNGLDVGTDAASYSLTTAAGDDGAAITVVVSGACTPSVTSSAAKIGRAHV